MPIPKIVGAQRDFSAGELDTSMKRADEHPLFKLGARQMLNWRILNSRNLQNRPGRSALFLESGRVDEVLMSPGNKFFLVFGSGYLAVYNAAGAQMLFSNLKGDGSTPIPWTALSSRAAVWAVNKFDIYICYADDFPNNVPQILSWDGASQTSPWVLTSYSEDRIGGQKQTVFYRISPPSVTIDPAASTGVTTATVSLPIFTPASIGTRISWCGRQATITGIRNNVLVVNNKVGGAVVVDNRLLGQTSGALVGVASITAQNPTTGTYVVTQLSGVAPIVGETMMDNNIGGLTFNVVSFTAPTIDATHPQAINLTCNETLPGSNTFGGVTIGGQINIGDVVEGASGGRGVVTGNGSAQTLYLNAPSNSTGLDKLVGQTANGATSGAKGLIVAQTAVSFSNGFFVFAITVNLSTSTAFVLSETCAINDTASGVQVAVGAIFLISGSSTTIVQIIPNANGKLRGFAAGEVLTGPIGTLTGTTVNPTAPQGVAVWADEVMNPTLRGYANAVTFDQNRLIFSNIPSVPSGIIWSTIGLPLDIHVDALKPIGSPDDAIFELVPQKSQALFVIAGPESGEFVFCDTHIFYIPIDVNNPLIPGSVAFKVLSSDGCANVQPRPVEEIIFYVNAGNLRVKAVIAPGNYYRPFNTEDVSENHTHLFTNVIALAAPSGDGTFPERYVYALNADNTLIVGKYTVSDGKLAGPIGWSPWSGAGTVEWVSALLADVIMWTNYQTGTAPLRGVIERLDDTQYLDAAIPVNNLPIALAPPGGKGPLWWLPSGTVTLIDNGTRMMDTYQIDANGFIIPKFSGGENLTSSTLVAGQQWLATLEPFVADAQPGQDEHQRMSKRRVSRMAVYVSQSTGFIMARLFSGPVTPTSPPLGTIMNQRRITTWNQGDNPTLPPPLREDTERWRPRGRSFDPRIAVIKDTPGPLMIHEIGTEVSV